MKKIILFAILVVALSQLNAQNPIDQAKSATGASSFDVSSLSKGIMDQLGPALSLTDVQKPSVLTEVTSFLTKKKDILPLQATDKAGYTSKLSGLTNGLTGKLKTILTAAQMTKFLGLKPKAASATNVLSQLFY